MNKGELMFLIAGGAAAVLGGSLYFLWKKKQQRPRCDASSCKIGTICQSDVGCVPAECNSDAECKDGKVCEGYKCADPFCDSDKKKCVNETDKCDGGRCMPGRCSEDYKCSEGSVCNTGSGTCVEDCTISKKCPSGFVCDHKSKACVVGECDVDTPCVDKSKTCDIPIKKCTTAAFFRDRTASYNSNVPSGHYYTMSPF